MNKRRFGLYISLGVVCGAALGLGLGQIWWGAMMGAFVGWFIAAAVDERSRAARPPREKEGTEHKG
jgi:hypothetical protein